MAKYRPFPRISFPERTWPDKTISSAPIWCSVDLRDGNQALAVPMNVEEKLEMFELLIAVGFKEIEVGFPSASNTEFEFIRRLIDEGRIPEDVTIQVLTQSRDHLIRRTFESIRGAARVIVHLYNSTSPLQRKITFGATKDQIKEIAVTGTKLVKELVETVPGTEVLFEYSPESFSDTEVDYAVEVCEAVKSTWAPDPEERIIFNLPDTVQWASPNIFADQVEWFCRHISQRDRVIVSVHTHNDRGTGVAASELGMMAGADRVEGTLFGNGERTGNVDIVTLALNMYVHGVDPSLDLRDLPAVQEVFERTTRMVVPARQPYAGELVFTAFSGSHQDAIKKGMDARRRLHDPSAPWEVPYLTIDPADIGRTYKAIIRINSQSGKGGVAYVLSRDFGYELPKSMQPEIGAIVGEISDRLSRELQPGEIFDIFRREYLEVRGPMELLSFSEAPHFEKGLSTTECIAEVRVSGKKVSVTGSGTGPIDAFVDAMKSKEWDDFEVAEFHEESLGKGSETRAAAYIRLETAEGVSKWGVGVDTNITVAGVKALVCAYNRLSGEASPRKPAASKSAKPSTSKTARAKAGGTKRRTATRP